MKQEFYTEQVFTRLTKTQKRRVKKGAKAAKETPSEWIRKAILGKLGE